MSEKTTVGKPEKIYAAPRKSEVEIFSVHPRLLKIKSDVRNPLKKITREDVADLISSYRERIARGLPPIRTALEVIRDEETGELILLTGRRRRRAAIYMKLEEVPIIYADHARKLTPMEELEHEISENSIRKDLYALDEARAILALIIMRGESINSFQKMIENAPEDNNSPEKVIVAYLKRLRASYGKDETIWKEEMIRNPIFKVIVDTMSKVGKDWYTYTERVLSFLNYRQSIQSLFNERIIGYQGAKKLNGIRDDEILSIAAAEIRESYKKNKSMNEKDMVADAVNKAFMASRDLKKIGSVIRITERVDNEFTRIDLGKNKYGWFFNRRIFADEPQSRKDMHNGALWNTPEVNSDISLPRTVYERLLHHYSKMGDKVVLVGQTNPEVLKIAMMRGVSAMHFAPAALSEHTYASDLDKLESIVYRDVPGRATPARKRYRIPDAQADLGILTLHPYGEIDVANDLSWENKSREPGHNFFTSDYYAQVGSIMKEMNRVCKKYAVITRYSEKKTKGGKSKELIHTPTLVSHSMMKYIQSVYYFRSQNGKMWSVYIIQPPQL